LEEKGANSLSVRHRNDNCSRKRIRQGAGNMPRGKKKVKGEEGKFLLSGKNVLPGTRLHECEVSHAWGALGEQRGGCRVKRSERSKGKKGGIGGRETASACNGSLRGLEDSRPHLKERGTQTYLLDLREKRAGFPHR